MVSSEEWRFTKHAWIATLFAVVTGYADVVSLVRYQAFASILTGNAIWLGRVAVDPKSDDQHTGCLVGYLEWNRLNVVRFIGGDANLVPHYSISVFFLGHPQIR